MYDSDTVRRLAERDAALWFRVLPCVVVVALGVPPALAAQDAPRRFAVEVEAGAVWQSYNDVEIPNDGSATRFSLATLAGNGPWPASRVYVTWQSGVRHGFRLLAAPLTIKGNGTPEVPLRFAGATYDAGTPLRATYTFNSYRVTYRYRLKDSDRSTLWVGFTGKIRDATIALEQGATASRKDDLGFVPLLHVSGTWRVSRDWRVALDADALAGGPGRAEDVAIRVSRPLGERWSVQGGYRLVEGGADVDDVYTFAWLHYAVLAIERRW